MPRSADFDVPKISSDDAMARGFSRPSPFWCCKTPTEFPRYRSSSAREMGSSKSARARYRERYLRMRVRAAKGKDGDAGQTTIGDAWARATSVTAFFDGARAAEGLKISADEKIASSARRDFCIFIEAPPYFCLLLTEDFSAHFSSVRCLFDDGFDSDAHEGADASSPPSRAARKI